MLGHTEFQLSFPHQWATSEISMVETLPLCKVRQGTEQWLSLKDQKAGLRAETGGFLLNTFLTLTSSNLLCVVHRGCWGWNAGPPTGTARAVPQVTSLGLHYLCLRSCLVEVYLIVRLCSIISHRITALEEVVVTSLWHFTVRLVLLSGQQCP